MIQIPIYGDERQLAFCAFCGGETGTKDHCPSRVLLDEPYPENLPTVPACATCNSRFSPDEEYLACLISCVLAGSSDPSKNRREKTRRILAAKPALRARLDKALINSYHAFSSEQHRIVAIVTKLAQGHTLYELHEPCPRPPDDVEVRPLQLMTDTQRQEFEYPPPPDIWPEVGSRALQRVVFSDSEPEIPWIEVQPWLYRFHASLADGITIRIVINEYLACNVHWAL